MGKIKDMITRMAVCQHIIDFGGPKERARAILRMKEHKEQMKALRIKKAKRNENEKDT